MATYSYKCRECEEEQTVQHPINDSPTILCAKCNAKMVKVFSAPQLQFRGGGWGKDAR
jgi:putative FmdB family regulatory protein